MLEPEMRTKDATEFLQPQAEKPKQCYIETWTLQSFSIYLIRRHYLEYTPYLNLAVHRGT